MFGIDLIDASLLPAMMIALVAGVLSFLSPCVLPIVPPYLAYMSGVSVTDLQSGAQASRKALLTAVFFVLGLSTVFLFLGFAASTFGALFLQNQNLFNTIAGVVVMFFGAHFLGIFTIPFLNRDARLDAGDRGGSAFGAFLLGLAFAFGWTPCIGPILGAILTVGAASATVSDGVALLTVYSLGLGVPFLLAAVFTDTLSARLKAIGYLGRVLRTLAAAVMIVMGIAMMTGYLSTFAFWLLETFPVLSTIG